MGLDIACNSIRIRVGSYSFVHINRIIWIKASLNYLKNVIQSLLHEIESDVQFIKFPQINQTDNIYNINVVSDYIANGDYENSEQLLTLENAMKLYNNLYNTILIINNKDDNDLYDERINYKLFGNLKDDLFENKLAGLYWWVCHSDCEGYLTPGQSFDIINTLKLLSVYFEDDNLFTSNNKTYDNYYLSPVFIESVEQNELILFT